MVSRNVTLPVCCYRCLEALVVYFKAGKKEEPYVTISRKISLKKGQGTAMEWEIGQTERTLATHRNAFKRTAVIQAFLGSTPQLTLQLYATIQEKYWLPTRCKNHLTVHTFGSYGSFMCSYSISIFFKLNSKIKNLKKTFEKTFHCMEKLISKTATD